MKIKNYLKVITEYNTFWIFLVMLLVSALVSDAFFTANNLSNLVRQVAPVGIISMGMLLVILTGGIDLSVGSVVAMIGVLTALFTHHMPVYAALLFAMACGVVAGSISGYLVAFHRLAPFIVTLAMMSIVRGLGFMFSKGAPVIIDDQASILTDFGSGRFLGIPNPALVMFIIFMITFILLRYNAFGRIVIAIGSNEESVRLSGIKVSAYKFSVYAIAGGLSALAGIVSTARTSVGSPVTGIAMELDVIAAVVIGGASLMGGKGSAVNTLLGVFILGMIGNIMNLLTIPAYSQQVIKGLIIVMAVFFQRFQEK
jgi:ribose transport system permease protein